MAIPVQVHDVRRELPLELQEPAAGVSHVVPRIFHPFEPVSPFGDLHAAGDRVLSLIPGERRTHDGQENLDTARTERLCEIGGVLPHAANAIRRHEDPTDRCTSAGLNDVRGAVSNHELGMPFFRLKTEATNRLLAAEAPNWSPLAESTNRLLEAEATTLPPETRAIPTYQVPADRVAAAALPGCR